MYIGIIFLALANLIGQKNRRKINGANYTILTFSAVLGIAPSVGMMLARRLTRVRRRETVLDQALLYIRIYFVEFRLWWRTALALPL